MSRDPTNLRNDDARFWPRFPNPVLAEELHKHGGEVTFRSVGWPTWGLLYHLAQAAIDPNAGRVQTLVELGVDQGYTTVVLAQAVHDLRVHGGVMGFDNREEAVYAASALLERAGLDRAAATLCADLSRPEALSDIWETLRAQDAAVAFVFVDFSKGYDENIVALRGATEILAEGGLIVVDNAWCAGIKKAVDEIDMSSDWAVTRLYNASWGFWPQRERGGTPGMAVLQRRV